MKVVRRFVVAAAVIVAAVGIVWYAMIQRPDPMIDTLPIGAAVEAPCTPDVCERAVRAALATLDARDAGHAAVVSTEWHRMGACLNGRGHLWYFGSQGGKGSIVFALVVREADGSTHAIGLDTIESNARPIADSSGVCSPPAGP